MSRINLDSPRYDQTTYAGRAKHFFIITNPLNLFATEGQLNEAKELVDAYRKKKEPAGVTEDEVWRAKHLCDSAYHPDTGEKMFLPGRMSAQVPLNMLITGCMMTFYRSTPAVIFWQWINQSFNAVVNYTNRSGKSEVSTKQLGVSYVLGTGTATITALGLNRMVKRMPPLVGRYVPFAAVAAANCINIPCMRSKELMEGVPVMLEDSRAVGDSKIVAKVGIMQVLLSRIVMAIPGMGLTPLVMMKFEKTRFMKSNPRMNAPVQVLVVGFFLICATPLCCAIFPQMSSVSISLLEDELQEKAKSMDSSATSVIYNKGL